jgi:hypothetical protein
VDDIDTHNDQKSLDDVAASNGWSRASTGPFSWLYQREKVEVWVEYSPTGKVSSAQLSIDGAVRSTLSGRSHSDAVCTIRKWFEGDRT